MKYRLAFVLFISTIICTEISAQSFNMKYYYDWNNGYGGYALARYLELSDRDMVISNFWAKEGRTITRLSNSISWLCWQALNEWNYKAGETYVIQCSEDRNGERGILLIATLVANHLTFMQNQFLDFLYFVRR